MQEDHRFALGIAALLDVDLLAIAQIQHPGVVGLDLGIQLGLRLDAEFARGDGHDSSSGVR